MKLLTSIVLRVAARHIDAEVRRRTAARVRQANDFAREVQADDARLRRRIEDLEGDLAIASAAVKLRDRRGLRERLAATETALAVEREHSADLYEELTRLREGDAPSARLSADERRQLHLLKEQNRALDARLHTLTITSMERDMAAATR